MKVFVVSMILILTIVGSWTAANLYLFEQQRSEHAVLLQKISEQACINNELDLIAQQGDYQKKYDAILNAELVALEKKIPATAETSGLLGQLSWIAEESKVGLHDFQAGKAQAKEFWFELPITLTLSASFPELVDFLRRVTGEERLMVVQDLKYGPGSVEIHLLAYYGNWRPEASLVLTGPYRCGEYVVPANLDSILTIPTTQTVVQKLDRDPFIVPEAPIALQDLHLTGVLEEGEQWMALLEDDRGVGRVVKVGDTVVDGFVVKQITKKAVSLEKDTETEQLTWSN